MEEVISMMNVVPGEIAEDDESGLALVPLPPPAESPDSNPPSCPPSRAPSSSSILSVDATEKALDPAEFFAAYLGLSVDATEKALDPAEFFAAYLGEDAKASAVQVHEKPRKPATPQVSKPTDLFLVGLMQSKELGGEDLAILKDVQEKPVDKKKPPQKAKAKSGKGKGKGKSVATPEVAKAAAVKKNSVKEAQEKKAAVKKKAVGEAKKDDVKDQEPQQDSTNAGMASDPPQEKSATKDKEPRFKPDHEVSLVVLRKRISCRAYKKAKLAAEKEGKSPEEAKNDAKKAFEKASAEFHKQYYEA
eukprot:s1525_g16.t1